MRDYLNIGSVPVDEPCAQVGADNYRQDAHLECNMFMNKLRQTFPWLEDEMTWFKIKGFAHDFGDYYEVVVSYDDADEESYLKAIYVENNTPMTWSDTKVFTETDFMAWLEKEKE